MVLLLVLGCQRGLQEVDPRLLYAGLTSGPISPVIDPAPRHPGDVRDLPNCGGRNFEPPVRGAFSSQENRLLAKASTPQIELFDQIVRQRESLRADVVVKYGEEPLREDWLRVFIGGCGGWGQVTEVRTDQEGRAKIAMRQRLPPGIYGLVVQVVGDASTTRAEIWVLPEETELRSKGITAAMVQGEGASGEEQGEKKFTPGVLVVYVDRDAHSLKSSLPALRARLRGDGYPVGPILGPQEWSALESTEIFEQTEEGSNEMIRR